MTITLTREEAQQVLDALGYWDNGVDEHAIHLCVTAIETLRARLRAPEPEPVAWVHKYGCRANAFGQCNMGCTAPPQREPKPEPVVKLKEMLEVQGRDGTWNYDPYFHGMYNGMEVMLAVLENRELVLRGAPEKWLSKKEWVGLTGEELQEIYQGGGTVHFKLAMAEEKLKEKNT